MSYRPLLERLFNQINLLLTRDFPTIPKSILPQSRGTFNVYKQFYTEHPWQRYIGIPNDELSFWEKIDKQFILFSRSMARYQELGLVLDDIIHNEDPLVIEAINRLPNDVREARERRISRAVDLSVQQKILPRSQWTKVEDDVPYLRPYILWVYTEMEEYDAELYTRIHFPFPSLSKFTPDNYEHGKIYKERLID
jgi:ubiquinol-cytochrome c reductase subunit 7